MNGLQFDNRVALVTGGGTGIGAATATLFARLGADVVIASRTEERLERTAAAIREATGRRCLAISANVKQRSGAIVNISSTAGISGVRGGAHYSSSKAALQMFTRVTAAEWGRYGIRCNCVAPGMIASELARKAWKKANIEMDSVTIHVPLRRPGEPEEVANAIVFLASDAASYITGETLAVAGGPNLSGITQD